MATFTRLEQQHIAVQVDYRGGRHGKAQCSDCQTFSRALPTAYAQKFTETPNAELADLYSQAADHLVAVHDCLAWGKAA